MQIVVNKRYVIKQVLDTDILIDTESNSKTIMKLNKVSKDIFIYVSNNKKIDDIVSFLLEKYNIDEDTVIKDTKDFISYMIDLGVFVEKK